MEWIHEGLPPIGSRALAWMDDGSVRHVSRGGFYGDLEFTDCKDPLQNVCCNLDRVKAWSLKEGQAPMRHEPIADAYLSPLNWLGNHLGL